MHISCGLLETTDTIFASVGARHGLRLRKTSAWALPKRTRLLLESLVYPVMNTLFWESAPVGSTHPFRWASKISLSVIAKGMLSDYIMSFHQLPSRVSTSSHVWRTVRTLSPSILSGQTRPACAGTCHSEAFWLIVVSIVILLVVSWQKRKKSTVSIDSILSLEDNHTFHWSNWVVNKVDLNGKINYELYFNI